MSKGLFLTVEGGDGSGKTTLVTALADRFKREKREVLCTREPGGTALSEKVRSLVLDGKESVSPVAELLLFLAARAEHLEKLIVPALKAGKVVICDRFNDSTIAYQGYARDLGAEYAKTLCQLACREKEPDLTFYLDLDPKIAFSRLSHRGKDRIEQEDATFHSKVRDGYLTLAKSEPERIYVLDASKQPEAVMQQAFNYLETHGILPAGSEKS